MNTRNVQNLFAAIIATSVVAYSQPALAEGPIRISTAPAVKTSFVTELPKDAQSPRGCLDELLSGNRVYGNCEAKGKTTECAKRIGPRFRKASACTSTIAINIVADTAMISPLSTYCYEVGIENRVDSRKGVVMSIQAIGKMCLTPQGNFIAADASCRTSDRSGKITMAAGDFSGYFIEADAATGRPTAIMGQHSDVP